MRAYPLAVKYGECGAEELHNLSQHCRSACTERGVARGVCAWHMCVCACLFGACGVRAVQCGCECSSKVPCYVVYDAV